MQKVAIVTDSIACLTQEQVARYSIQIVPINLYAGGKLYKDWIDITPSKAYELFLEDPASFRTSAASPEDCLNAYREASKLATNILFIIISAKLSNLYNVARLAQEQIKAEQPGISIEVMDSRTATAAEGFVALAAAKAATNGEDLTDVIKAAQKVKDSVNIVALLETVRYVYRTGRIPKVAALAGAMLNIKPIFTFVSGAPSLIGIVRNKPSGIEKMLKMVKDRVGRKPIHAAVMHAYAPEEAIKLKERVANEFNCVELWLTEFSPVMGYACGTGTLGIAFYTDS